MGDFFVTIWESTRDWKEGDDGVAIVFPSCTKEESDWLTNFCLKHKKPITIAILPDGDVDGDR